MRYDIHGRYIGCENNDARRRRDGGVCGEGGFAEGFNDFFDAAFEGFVFGGWINTQFLLAGEKTCRKEGLKVPFLTDLSTFLHAFSSANGFANGTRAPTRGATLTLTSSMPFASVVADKGSMFSRFSSNAAVRVDTGATSAAFFSFFSFLLLWMPSFSERFSFFSFLSFFRSSLSVFFSFAIIGNGS